MTYAELLQSLYELSPEQLQATVTVLVDDEYFAAHKTFVVNYDDVLDRDHFVLVVETSDRRLR